MNDMHSVSSCNIYDNTKCYPRLEQPRAVRHRGVLNIRVKGTLVRESGGFVTFFIT